MKIEPFALERWMTTYEMDVEYDVAESGILPLTANDLLALEPPAERDAALARLLDLRVFPRLRFHWDPTPENADHIEQVLADLRKKSATQ